VRRSIPSPSLRAFVAKAPLDRRYVLAIAQEASDALPSGARVLDAGAGDSPYRELFSHCDYVASDWAASPHPGARQADVIAPLDDLPLDEASFDAVLCTQVLEHVADPLAVLVELRRVLRPGGRLWLTVPLVGELHEEPHDYFRYTPYGLRSLAERAALEVRDVEALGGYFTALAQLIRNCGPATGVGAGAPFGRRLLAAAFRAAAAPLPKLDRLDDRRALSLGYALRAQRPASAP
jgi:SAM-dependent methyltransferase